MSSSGGLHRQTTWKCKKGHDRMYGTTWWHGQTQSETFRLVLISGLRGTNFVSGKSYAISQHISERIDKLYLSLRPKLQTSVWYAWNNSHAGRLKPLFRPIVPSLTDKLRKNSSLRRHSWRICFVYVLLRQSKWFGLILWSQHRIRP